MIIKMRCPQCDADLSIEDNKEVFFCQYCGTKLVNLPQEQHLKKQEVHVIQTNDYSNEPNLVIVYNSVDGITTMSTNIKEINQQNNYSNGETRSFRLDAGNYTVEFRIGLKRYVRTINIPVNYTLVRIACNHGNVNTINIDQPGGFASDYKQVPTIKIPSHLCVNTHMNYMTLVNELIKIGFKDIAAMPMKDLNRWGKKHSGEVGSFTVDNIEMYGNEIDSRTISGSIIGKYNSSSVRIGGNRKFKADTKIVILFHSLRSGNDSPYYYYDVNTQTQSSRVIPTRVEYVTVTDESHKIYENAGSHSQISEMNNVAAGVETICTQNPINTAECDTSFKTYTMPDLINRVLKGQKVLLESQKKISKIKVCLGWNTKDNNGQVEVGTFMINSSGMVVGNDWYLSDARKTSPDESIRTGDNGIDRKEILINFDLINKDVNRVIFVMSVNDSITQGMNFSMINDAYIRILDGDDGTEIVSFLLEDYYSNITSMMIGEVYLYNGKWKFNAVGNGMAKDFNGVCKFYGVDNIR